MKSLIYSYNIFSLMGLLLLITGCSQSTENANNASDKVDKDALIERLSADLVANPKTQKEEDQNIIVNYAIDNELNVQRSETGLYYQIIEEGEGRQPNIISNVVTHYRGTFLDGREFDSSYKRDEPLSFTLTQVIPGWQEGIQKLRPGGKALLLVPSHLGYGTKGYPDLIEPNSVLRFDVELISFK